MWERFSYDEFFEMPVRFYYTLYLCFEYPRSLKVYCSQAPVRLPRAMRDRRCVGMAFVLKYSQSKIDGNKEENRNERLYK